MEEVLYMGYMNYRFLETYKLLDKLCRDIYQGDKGVTAYIDDMKATPQHESRAIVGWHADLCKLIALRHLRNQLTHECGTLEQDMCSESDIDWLNDFYDRILHQTDPLALRIIQDNRNQYNAERSFEDSSGNGTDEWLEKPKRNGSKAAWLLLWLLFALGLYIWTFCRFPLL